MKKQVKSNIYPFFGIFLVFFTLLSFQFTLNEYAKNQANNVKQLISYDLAINDSLSASKKLANIAASSHAICIIAKNNNHKFYTYGNECKTSFFSRTLNIQQKENPNYLITLTVRLPFSIEIIFTLLVIVVVISTFLLSKYARKLNLQIIEAELEKKSALIKLSSKIAHDIRSPIIALRQSLKNNSKELALSSLEMIEGIADQLLDERKKGINSVIEVSKVVTEVISEKSLTHKNITIINSIKNNPKVIANRIKIKSILSNLLNNSIEAGATKIEIETSESTTINLEIRDNGPGFPDSVLKSFTTNTPLGTKKGSNAIGLFTAKEYAESIGATVNISNNKGHALVEFSFQIVLNENKQTVLIDDDRINRATWEMSFKKENLKLITFGSTKEFLQSPPDKDSIIYIDSDLGESISGQDFAKKLFNDGYKNLHLATGYSSDDFKEYTFLKSIIGKTPPI